MNHRTELYDRIVKHLRSREVVSSLSLQAAFSLRYVTARQMVQRLQNENLIACEWDRAKQGYLVKKWTTVSHYIPEDFNQNSLCGLTKAEWKGGTNNWEWVTCPECLEHHPETDS